MTDVYRCDGSYFGWFEGSSLYTFDGRHVGERRGREVFASNGRYLGELDTDCLMTDAAKKSTRKGLGFAPSIRMAPPLVRMASVMRSVMPPGYEDFPAPDTL